MLHLFIRSTQRRVMEIFLSHTEIMPFPGEQRESLQSINMACLFKFQKLTAEIGSLMPTPFAPLGQHWCWCGLDRMIEILLPGGTVVIPGYSTCGSFQPAAAGLSESRGSNQILAVFPMHDQLGGEPASDARQSCLRDQARQKHYSSRKTLRIPMGCSSCHLWVLKLFSA